MTKTLWAIYWRLLLLGGLWIWLYPLIKQEFDYKKLCPREGICFGLIVLLIIFTGNYTTKKK